MKTELSKIAEIQGLYGAVSVSELLIQKIWLRGDYSGDNLRTMTGEPLRIVRPGRWNRLEGPDFLDAEIEIGGQGQVGDIEIHFYQNDWKAHRHSDNRAFSHVILHVVVFDPGVTAEPLTDARGRQIPTLVLAPLLKEGLEEYALADALRTFELADPLELAGPMLEMSLTGRRGRLIELAMERWRHKLHFASRRIQNHGIEAACHQAVLEILGYRRNRSVMADIALKYPLEVWRDFSDQDIERLLIEFRPRWELRGVRPPNQPARRLRQYLELVRQRPDWAQAMITAMGKWRFPGALEESTRAYRQRHRLGPFGRELSQDIMAAVIGSSRFNTVMIDGLIPLADARSEGSLLESLWYHWSPGDAPANLKLFLRTVGVVDPGYPLSNGLQQGALQLMFSRENPLS